MKTAINFSVNVEIETEDTVDSFLQHHGASNFEFHASKSVVAQLKEAVEAQCRENNAELYEDRQVLRAAHAEIRALFDRDEVGKKIVIPSARYNHVRALELMAIARRVTDKYNAPNAWAAQSFYWDRVAAMGE